MYSVIDGKSAWPKLIHLHLNRDDHNKKCIENGEKSIGSPSLILFNVDEIFLLCTSEVTSKFGEPKQIAIRHHYENAMDCNQQP